MDEALPRRLTVARFRWRARFGFFLRAEAARAGYGYPVPPRTAVLGVIANVLGLAKDALATELAEAHVAVSGAAPRTHWHKGNYRKDPPAPLPYEVKAKGKEGATAPEVNTQLRQEWLLSPDYLVTAALPDRFHARFVEHLRAGTSHFTPCMGLSEMLASVEPAGEHTLDLLPPGAHAVGSVVRLGADAEIDAGAALAAGLHVLMLSMPREVTPDRRFSHATFLVERAGRPLPCRTSRAYGGAGDPIVFL